MSIRRLLTEALALTLLTLPVQAEVKRSPSLDDGLTCDRGVDGTGACTFVVQCATGTCTNPERAAYQTMANTEARLGDTIKFKAGQVFPGYNTNVLELFGRTGNGYLTITTTEDDKLPPDGTRITPAYRSLMPTFRMDVNTAVGIALAGTNNPVEHVRIRGIRFVPQDGWKYQFSRGSIQVGNSGADWNYCESTLCLPGSNNVLNAVANPAGAVRLTVNNHGWSNGDYIVIYNVGGVPAVSGTSSWPVSVVDANTVDLVGSVFSGAFTWQGKAGRQRPLSNINDQPDDIVIQHCLFEQDGWGEFKRTGILLNARQVVVKDNFIDGIQSYDGEAKAIASVAGQGPFTITNNYVMSTGENIFFGGGRPSTYTTPSNISLQYNYVTKTEERYRRRKWSPGLYVFKGAVIYTRTNTGTATSHVYIALTSGKTGSVEPGNTTSGQITSWPATAYSLSAGCKFTPGSHTCVIDGGVTWARYATGSGAYWQVKNNFECKACKNVDVSWNVFDKNWINGQDAMINIKTANQCLSSIQDRATFRSGYVNTVPLPNGKTRLVWSEGDTLPFILGPDSNTDPTVYKIKVNGNLYTIDSSTDSALFGKAGFVSPYEIVINEGIATLTHVPFSHGHNRGPDPSDVVDRCFEAETANVTFRNNVVRNGPVALKTLLGVNANFGNLRDIFIRNNLFHNIDRCVWADAYSGGCTTKWDLSFNGPHPNFWFENNSVLSTSGAGVLGPYATLEPGARRKLDLPGAMTNNILIRGSSMGVKASGVAEGAASIDQMFCGVSACPPEKWRNNLLMGANAAVYYGASRTSTLCPSGTATCGPNGYTTPYRLLFTGYDLQNFRIRLTAAVARKAGTNGYDLGPDFTQLPEISNLRVIAAAQTAVLSYEVSKPIAHVPCVVQVSRDRDLSTTIEDLDPSLPANASVAQDLNADSLQTNLRSGLSRTIAVGTRVALLPGTEYWYFLMCGGDARKGSFTTAVTANGIASSNTEMKVIRQRTSSQTAGFAVEYGYSYDAAANGIAASVTSAVSSCNQDTCSATLRARNKIT